GDLVAIWAGDPMTTNPIDTASYPDTAPFDGRTYDVSLGAFSEVANASNAVQTLQFGGDGGDVPNIGSPGNGLAIKTSVTLKITEIFSGQEGADITADWFEIYNYGLSEFDEQEMGRLYFDDDSADPSAASEI